MPLDNTAILLKAASDLQCEIERCRNVVETAELKRREIAAKAELIHGECDSQIASEQQLFVLVKLIDSILRYFDDLGRLSLDFMSGRSSMITRSCETESSDWFTDLLARSVVSAKGCSRVGHIGQM
jgi:hypothetical protein